MLSLPSSVRVFVVVAPFDMRGSFDALAGAVPGDGSDQRPPVPLSQQAPSARQGGLVRRLGLAGIVEATRAGKLPAAAHRGRRLAGLDRWHLLRCALGRHRLRGGASRLAPASREHGRSHGDRQRTRDVIWCGGGYSLNATARERRAPRAAREAGHRERRADGATARDKRRADGPDREAQRAGERSPGGRAPAAAPAGPFSASSAASRRRGRGAARLRRPAAAAAASQAREEAGGAAPAVSDQRHRDDSAQARLAASRVRRRTRWISYINRALPAWQPLRR
jgi:hypothetical protein